MVQRSLLRSQLSKLRKMIMSFDSEGISMDKEVLLLQGVDEQSLLRSVMRLFSEFESRYFSSLGEYLRTEKSFRLENYGNDLPRNITDDIELSIMVNYNVLFNMLRGQIRVRTLEQLRQFEKVLRLNTKVSQEFGSSDSVDFLIESPIKVVSQLKMLGLIVNYSYKVKYIEYVDTPKEKSFKLYFQDSEDDSDYFSNEIKLLKEFN